jgi:hypothetical protein
VLQIVEQCTTMHVYILVSAHELVSVGSPISTWISTPFHVLNVRERYGIVKFNGCGLGVTMAALQCKTCNIRSRFVASITLLTHAGLSLLDQFAGFWTQRSFGVFAQSETCMLQPQTCSTLAIRDECACCMTAKQGMIRECAAGCLAQHVSFTRVVHFWKPGAAATSYIHHVVNRHCQTRMQGRSSGCGATQPGRRTSGAWPPGPPSTAACGSASCGGSSAARGWCGSSAPRGTPA